MFRSRSKDDQGASATPDVDLTKQPRDPQAPKGRPTPKRSEAQAQRRAVAKVPANRKEAAKRARETRRAEMARQRQAMATGDERYLPLRDRGPERRFARDFVDGKWHVAEFFLPIALVIFAMNLVQNPQAQNMSLLLWLGVIVMIVADSFVTVRRLKKGLRERFPNENLRGVTLYALMRTLQMRRMRLPKPQVARGEAPRR
ncbi:DUF3043 domain-containing protein [Streptomyces sp. TRM 70351]|uniref:DUF3043 domain-containing protein n=1 Tax=Streptomyces sp. TRM 70351 TaxID=3116552 RepID=UPI002E7AF854|nr:DUF3043 domain-containing protein [Streptomyces sp. TRM 70351]MEE1928671.1 DUF3043 domain-containing protein [Streptomyces sp. TRM 70351]